MKQLRRYYKYFLNIYSYSTHQPLLEAIVRKTTGPVIEFGCGFGSTLLLHDLCQKKGRLLYTLETDYDWLQKFVGFSRSWHKFIYVRDWQETLNSLEINGIDWQVAFIDQSPMLARYETIRKFKNKIPYMVLHDCDYYPEYGIFGKSLEKLNGPDHLGRRTYDDEFKYYREYFPKKPWPHPTSGPPTLLASNFVECDLPVTYSRFKIWGRMLWYRYLYKKNSSAGSGVCHYQQVK